MICLPLSPRDGKLTFKITFSKFGTYWSSLSRSCYNSLLGIYFSPIQQSSYSSQNQCMWCCKRISCYIILFCEKENIQRRPSHSPWEAGDGLIDTRYIPSHPAPTAKTLAEDLLWKSLVNWKTFLEDLLLENFKIWRQKAKTIQIHPAWSGRTCNSEWFVRFYSLDRQPSNIQAFYILMHLHVQPAQKARIIPHLSHFELCHKCCKFDMAFTFVWLANLQPSTVPWACQPDIVRPR